MHNLSNEYFQNEFESNSNEYGNELAPEFEFSNEYSNESIYELSPEFEFENQEMEVIQSELAQELMEISDEAEFGAWVKRLGKKAAGAAYGFLNSQAGQQATKALGDIAQKTLPSLGSKVGGWAGSQIGKYVGQKLGSTVAQSAVDRYPQFVKMATDTIGKLAQEFEAGKTPAVKPAIVRAAKKHYPIILQVKGTLNARTVKGNLNSESEFNYEYDNEYNEEFDSEMDGEIGHNEGTFNEITEMELASELLSIQSEAELDMFLGKLFKKAVGTVKKFAKSSTGRALGGMLKGLAKKALPIAGAALGSAIAPGIGTSIGSSLGSAASNLFELELEGLSAEDREFETARAFVRFAGNSARRASRMGNQNPSAAARNSIKSSARRYAPGLLVRSNPTTNNYSNSSGDENGTWYRDGNRIIIEGV